MRSKAENTLKIEVGRKLAYGILNIISKICNEILCGRAHATFCVGSSNVCPACHRLPDILRRNMHDLDLDF